MWASKLKVMAPNCVVIGLSHGKNLLGSSSNLQSSIVFCVAEEVGDFVRRAHAEKAEGGLQVVKVSYQFCSI
jgi:hypothetical protein